MMLSKLKNHAIKLTGPYGGHRIIKLLSGHKPRVIMYHRFSSKTEDGKVSAAIFDQQMAELKNNFNVVPLSMICNHIRDNKSLPRNTIAITIDDGYADFYQYAYPVLKKYQLPSTLYITTDFIDRKIWLWPDKITYILENSKLPNLTVNDINHLSNFPITTRNERKYAWPELIGHCLLLTEQDRSDFINSLAANQRVIISSTPTDSYAPISWDEIIEISNNAVDIGAHTITHPVLSKLNTKQLEIEISGSKKRIEDMINKPVTNFCYPNGQPADYNEQTKKVVVESGYTSATVAFYDKLIWNDLFEIRRYGVDNDLFQYKKTIYGAKYLSSLYK